MDQSMTAEVLGRAEAMLVAGDDEGALRLLATLAADVEEYVDRNCPTTEDVQWFSFPTFFDRLAYRRVEDDPRELHDTGEPFDRIYADLAFAQVRLGDYDGATGSLKQAVRWDPMNCGYRLDLAELFRNAGDANEYLALTFSVFERASEAPHLVRAFLNFADYFGQVGKAPAQAAALRCARRIDGDDPMLQEAVEKVAGTEGDPDSVSDEQATTLLAAEGLPDGANAEIAICLLMCATDAADAGERNLATNLTVRARDLVGAAAAAALIELIHETSGSDGGGADAS